MLFPSACPVSSINRVLILTEVSRHYHDIHRIQGLGRRMVLSWTETLGRLVLPQAAVGPGGRHYAWDLLKQLRETTSNGTGTDGGAPGLEYIEDGDQKRRSNHQRSEAL